MTGLTSRRHFLAGAAFGMLTGASACSAQWPRASGGTLRPEQFGARAGGFDDRRVQAALDTLANGQDLYLGEDFQIASGALRLTDRRDIRIYGPGRLILDGGAPDDCMLLKLVGTCQNISVQGLRFLGPGRGDPAARQNGVGNSSGRGQNLSQINIDGCAFEGLNAGVVLTTESGGSVANAAVTNNRLSRMVGILGGQGYGIVSVGARDVVIARNHIEDAERHSIYVARLAERDGDSANVLVEANRIRNHRRTKTTGETRAAIFMGRGFGGRIVGNMIADYWGGAIVVCHDSGGEDRPARQCGDIEISGNSLVGRRNVVPSLIIGEQGRPGPAFTRRIAVRENSFRIDLAVAPPQFEIEIYNGRAITIADNDIQLANVPGGRHRLIGIGTQAGPGDIADVDVERNRVAGTAPRPAAVALALVRLAASQSRGNARIVVRDNDNRTGFSFMNVDDEAARTNRRIVDQPPP